jgi:head-tail adaptor
MAWRAPRAAEFRDRITIQRKQQISNGGGGFTDTWVAVLGDVPAKIVATRGGESVQALRLSGTTPYDITIRASAATDAITAGYRAVNSRTGEALNVKWVGNLQEGRKAFLTLSCVSGEPAHG